ncbi:MAG: outer membrane protein assembly factor BamA [Gammaproteobacteria bacterium]|nr:outer membrane protein assembly factor BamA [Gammaproteobacteria bacterium]
MRLISAWLYGLLFTVCLAGRPAGAFEPFIVKDIRVEGLQRISAGTVFNYLPVKVGDKRLFNENDSRRAIQALFKTGFFSNIRLERENGNLIVSVEERPAIAEITYTGSRDVDEEMRKALKEIGFAEGRVFQRALLEEIEQVLQSQSFSQGKYAVRIETTVTPRARNRVDIQVDIVEGDAAKIRQIILTGNKAFSTGKLLGEFELSTSTWTSFITDNDQYSKQKLAADLEILRAYYLDRGYINFNIDSTQVSITPDKRHIYITINMTEGKKYTVKEVKLAGNLIVPEETLMKKISIKPGSVFSRKEMTASIERLSERIGDEGYIFASINPVPDFDTETDTVTLRFFVDPGRRVYVRRINFSGNTKTRDEVLRREMRQMESGWASSKNIKRSRIRLERLGFFETVDVETIPVAEAADQVDINYSVVEKPSGNLMAGIGYSQTQGILLNASISQDNFLGSGKRVGVSFNNSRVTTLYSLSYTDPFHTIDGVSRGFKVYYRSTDAAEANLSRYAMDRVGGLVSYGVPINEHDIIRIGFEPSRSTLETTTYSADEVRDFISAHGDSYDMLTVSGGWAHDTRNRALFPDRGVLQSLGGEFSVPFSDLTFYKLNFRQEWYYPLSDFFTLHLKGNIGYGDGYGGTEYPFFENYTAGGPLSVRGYEENTLGPHDSNDRSMGGNLRTVGNAEIMMPMPFIEKSPSFRLLLFVDAGNVYGIDEDFDAGLLRYSTGIAALWYSPLGGLSFSLAKPLHAQEGDETRIFQFSIGARF